MCLNFKNFAFVAGILTTFSFVLPSCDKLYSNYLHENYQLPETHYLATENDISRYVDSVKMLLPFSKAVKSMTYTLGNYSFQVCKYMHKGQPFLYIEKGDSGEYGKTEKYYYIKNNELILVEEKSVLTTLPIQYNLKRVYLNEGQVLYAEQKTGLNESELKDQKFERTVITPFNYIKQIGIFEDALYQKNKFDLVFDGIAEYPKAKYLIFSKKEINAYRAPVKVENEDEFIHELYSNPLRYRGEKLDINWKINDNQEVIYASGKLKARD